MQERLPDAAEHLAQGLLAACARHPHALALSGNALGGTDGMDFIRQLILDAPAHMSEHAVLVLEIGNEQAYFDVAFPGLDVIWLDTSAGEDQVLLVTRHELIKNLKRNDSLDHS